MSNPLAATFFIPVCKTDVSAVNPFQIEGNDELQKLRENV